VAKSSLEKGHVGKSGAIDRPQQKQKSVFSAAKRMPTEGWGNPPENKNHYRQKPPFVRPVPWDPFVTSEQKNKEKGAKTPSGVRGICLQAKRKAKKTLRTKPPQKWETGLTRNFSNNTSSKMGPSQEYKKIECTFISFSKGESHNGKPGKCVNKMGSFLGQNGGQVEKGAAGQHQINKQTSKLPGEKEQKQKIKNESPSGNPG